MPPKKKEAERKLWPVHSYFNEKNRKIVCQAATRAGLSVGTWVAMVALEEALKKLDL